MYREIERGVDRPFEIMLGMREGYGDHRTSPEHAIGEVIAAHHAWQERCGIVQGIAVTPCQLSYGWPENGHTHGASEPACLVTGNINVLYDSDISDEQAQARILSLAEFMAQALGQTRVYVRCWGQSIILQDEIATTPTGD